MQAFYAGHYVPDHAVLVIIGDASAADLMAKAEQAFGGWRQGGSTLEPLPAPTRSAAGTSSSSTSPTPPRPTSASATPRSRAPIRLRRRQRHQHHPRRRLRLALIDELRVKRSLTYGAWSGFAARKVPGDFRVGTFTKVDTTGEALRSRSTC